MWTSCCFTWNEGERAGEGGLLAQLLTLVRSELEAVGYLWASCGQPLWLLERWRDDGLPGFNVRARLPSAKWASLCA
jgi:hypothetical protein